MLLFTSVYLALAGAGFYLSYSICAALVLSYKGYIDYIEYSYKKRPTGIPYGKV